MTSRFLLCLAALALSSWLPLAAQAADPASPAITRLQAAKPNFPELVLGDAKAQGQRAVDLLGSSLPAVAAWYGKSGDEFKAMLINDKHLRVDKRGRLFVEDQIEAALPATAAEQSVLDGTLLPVDQTFLLHSRPGAKRTIYLNFKGATLSGTAWNSGTATITALPFDLDGVPGTFSTAEMQRIQYIWQRVSEDYAPFDVDVTTEAPTADKLTRTSSSDQIFGTTVVITKTTGVYSCSCGGVAYVGVFDDTSDFHKPALVFYDKLGSGTEKYVAEAISHEAGHNMGLQHDGFSGGAYYGGHGTGVTSWAPIMGTGYNRSLVQWSKGQYATANNTQDDYTVMEANGLPIRLDDHGDTIATATALTAQAAGGISTYATAGVIERPGDIDMFRFTAAAGTVTVTLNPASRSPNLDALVELRNSAGTVLASANPEEALNASVSFAVPLAGTYYVSVQGVGKGDPLTTGYSNYGSVGNYTLTVTALTTAGTPPVATIVATPTAGIAPLTVSLSGAGSTDSDGTIASYAWVFGDGSTASGASTSKVYTAAGTYTAVLTVTDNSGLTATKSVVITVNAGNKAPVAAVTATPVSGTAPVTVNFSGAGSTDSDGTIASYAWAFGDGTTGTGVTASKIYNTAGTYTAVLTVTDNGGLKATKSVVITVAAANKAPVAAVTATPIFGTAPLTVNFSGAGSTDPDGTIAAYQWTFGDGGTATGATTSHLYTAAGTYTAQLRVVDNLGLSAIKNVPITVNAAAAGPVIRVAAIALSVSMSGGRAQGVAVVKVVDSKGVGVAGAVITGTWSGIASGTASLTSNSIGNVTFVTAPTSALGTFTFTVNSVVRSGYTYDPSQNTETTDSVAR